MYDSTNSITLLVQLPDFRQMAYVSIDDMVAGAWISPTVVELNLPVAIANIRNKLVAGFRWLRMIVHLTANTGRHLRPAMFVTVKAFLSFQTPVLQDYLK